MAGERGVAGMGPALASLKDQGGDRLGVVPPDFLGYAAEELEGRGHSFEDRLGALEGEGQYEGIIRVGPGGDKKGDLASAVGEVDVDVAEIGFEALAGEMSQRDEGFLMSPLVLEQIALHLAVASGIAVLVAETTERLHGGVALLGGSVIVIDQNLVDDRLERAENLGRPIPGLGCWIGFRMLQDMPDRGVREIVITGDLADGLAIPTRPPNGAIIVHRKHLLDLRASE